MTIRATGKPEGCKLIRIEAEVDFLPELTLVRIIIRGDFFAIPEEGFERIEASLAGLPATADSLATAFDSLAAREGVELFGICGAGVAEVFGRALDAARIQTA